MSIATTTMPTAGGIDRAVVRRSTPEHRVDCLLTGEETDGRFALIETTLGKHDAPPRHVHRNEDEIHYVIAGELTFEIAGRRHPAPAGTTVFAPRGTEHGLAVESAQARVLVMFVPAGVEGFFRLASRPSAGTDHAAPPSPADVARMQELAARYGIEITGPPLTAPR